MRRKLSAKANAEMSEIDKNIAQIKRQKQTNKIDAECFEKLVRVEIEKEQRIVSELSEKLR